MGPSAISLAAFARPFATTPPPRAIATCLVFASPGRSANKASLTEAERGERRKYEDLALETLQQAVAKGFTVPSALRTDAAWAAPRDRPEFQLALKDVTAKKKVIGIGHDASDTAHWFYNKVVTAARRRFGKSLERLTGFPAPP